MQIQQISMYSRSSSVRTVEETLHEDALCRQEGRAANFPVDKLLATTQAEVRRQGEMAFQLAGGGGWETCHFVLTRSCFLHWFTAVEKLSALDGIRLARCQVSVNSCTTIPACIATHSIYHIAHGTLHAFPSPNMLLSPILNSFFLCCAMVALLFCYIAPEFHEAQRHEVHAIVC